MAKILRKAMQCYARPDKSMERVRMFELVGSMQRAVDLLRMDRVASPMRRSVRVLAVLVCGVAMLLVGGVGSASAYKPSSTEEAEAKAHEESFIKRTTPLEFTMEECGPGESCRFTSKYVLPPGWFLVSNGDYPELRTHEFSDEGCSDAEKNEGCTIHNRETREKSTQYLAPGYKELYQVDNYRFLTNSAMRESYLISIYAWKPLEKENERFGPNNPGEPEHKTCSLGWPVNCATGNQFETQTDLKVGGRGLGLNLTRTYNSQLAAKQKEHGLFGFGWTGPYSAHLEIGNEGKEATVYQDNGSTITFTRGTECTPPTCIPTGPWIAPSTLVEATLADEGSGYIYTLPNQTKMYFNSEGKLTSEADRNGNTLTMSYESGHLSSVADGAGRKLTFSYNGEGEVESAKDPMGHTVKYTYEGGNLKSVSQPAESALRWQFKYNGEHELTSETDGRSHTVTTEYNGSHQVISQTDALSRKREWKYGGPESEPETTITEPNGATTVEKFNEYSLPTSVTHAYGTSIAATTTYEYNEADELIALTDPNKHKTEYGYDSAGDKTSEKDANGDERKWKYNSTHDVETETTPGGETTTIKRNSAGDP